MNIFNSIAGWRGIKKIFKFSLFWKILGWFWLSMIIIAMLNLYLGHLSSSKIHFRPIPPPIQKELSGLIRKLDRPWFQQKFSSRAISKRFKHIYLIDAQQDEYFQRRIPEMLAILDSRVKRNNQPQSVLQNKQTFFGGNKVSIGDKHYRLYIGRAAPFISRHFIGGFFKEVAKSLLFSVFIISFPLSFLLSWLITRPIRRLQKATQDIRVDLTRRESLQQLLARSDEFGELARDFEHMADHVNNTLQSQKQLLSDVSHELRSPLSRLQIALGIIEQKKLAGADSNLQRIKLESQRMNEMLTDLLAISQIEAQEQNIQKEKFDLCQLLTLVIDDGRFEAEQSNCQIIVDLPDACLFYGVKEVLVSGVENILRNAIRYAGDMGVITCRLTETQEQIILKISDTGPGVNAQQLAHIFDAFYRTDNNRSRKTGGVGLGLSIAKRAFKLNAGDISAKNIEPNGLEVTVKFNKAQFNQAILDSD